MILMRIIVDEALGLKRQYSIELGLTCKILSEINSRVRTCEEEKAGNRKDLQLGHD